MNKQEKEEEKTRLGF